MEPATTPSQRLSQARRFAVAAASLAADTRAKDVVLLDVNGISPVTDFFILATGISARQMRTVCEQIEELGKSHDFSPLARSGYDGENWMLIDFVDVVVHLFSPEARLFYDLDNLWGDARRIDWKPSE